MDPAHYAKYVTGVRFRRALFGYRRADVDQHLQAVKGWFSLSGVDEVLRQRSNELVDDARREADEITATARWQAHALVAEARREAELERLGRSRIGRPVGDGVPVARTDRFARR